jgi:hypothetical protein
MKFILSLLLLSMHSIAHADSLSCPQVTYAQLKSELKDKGEVNVIFFASWCVSCKPHLTRSHPDNTVFVVAFDEQERAEKTLNSFSVKQRCFTSDDTAKALGVRSLPATKSHKF